MSKKKKTTPWKKIPTFDKFVKYKRNEGASVNELKRRYRDAGGHIGNTKANKVVQEVFGRERDISKRNTIKYYKQDNAPTKKRYLLPNRIHYIVKYKVDREGFAEPETRYATLITDEKLTKKEVIDYLYEQHEDLKGNKHNYYNPIGIVERSIEILYAVDTFAS